METYNCTICPAKFKTLKGLENHKCRWICDVCGKRLTTEKGYLKHKSNHGKNSTNKANAELLRIEQQTQQIEKYNQLKAEIIGRGLFNPLYKIGDIVFVSTFYVTKPTHKWNGLRMVHIRYEEERCYRALQTTIKDVQMSSNSYHFEFSLKENKDTAAYYRVNGDDKQFTESDFSPSLQLAEKNSKERKDKYKEACDFASMCR